MRFLRALAFNLFFVLLTLVLGLAGLAVRLAAPRLAFPLARSWIRVTVAGLRVIGGVRIVVTGREHLPDGPAVIASQHQAGIDTLLWFTLVPRPSYVMKQELRRIPLVGPLLEPAGMIPVDRSAGAAALRDMRRRADAALAAGRQIVIFPEGTRLPPGTRGRLQPGIAALAGRGAPMIPVATDSGHAWGRGMLLRLRGRGRDVIQVHLGAPLPTAAARADILSGIESSWCESERIMSRDACGQVCARTIGKPGDGRREGTGNGMSAPICDERTSPEDARAALSARDNNLKN